MKLRYTISLEVEVDSKANLFSVNGIEEEDIQEYMWSHVDLDELNVLNVEVIPND